MSNENETKQREEQTNTTPNNVVSITAWKNRAKFTESMIDAEPWVPPTERVPDPKPVKKPSGGGGGIGGKKKDASSSANSTVSVKVDAADFFAQSARTSGYVINAYADLIYLLTTAMTEIEQGSTDPKIIQLARTTNATTAKILKQISIDLGLS